MGTESTTLKAGDVCLDCKQQGFEKHLRYFKLNLNGDVLLKCESNVCMYPYNDDIESTDDEEESTDSLKFIEDFMQQICTETEEKNTNINLKVKEAGTVDFDISFFDNLNIIENDTLCKPVKLQEDKRNLDNKSNENIINNQVSSVTILDIEECEIPATFITACSNEQNDNYSMSSFVAPINDTAKVCKPKIYIQSIEVLENVSTLCNISMNKEKPCTISNTARVLPSVKISPESLQFSPTKLKSPSNAASPPIKNVSSVSEIKLSTITTSAISSSEFISKLDNFDIPKANITKRSNTLSILQKVKVKAPKLQPNFKDDNKIKEPLVPPSFNTDSEISCDMLAKFFNESKIRRKRKK